MVIPNPTGGESRSIQVREVVAADWPQVKDIRLRMLMHDPGAYGDTYDSASTQPDQVWIERATESEAGEDRKTFAAIDGDRFVGAATCLLLEEDHGGAYLVGMWVDPAFRGRGIGSELLRQTSSWAQMKSATYLRLHVNKDQSAARRMYEGMRFAYTGNSKPMDRDPSITLLEMRLDLPGHESEAQIRRHVGSDMSQKEPRSSA